MRIPRLLRMLVLLAGLALLAAPLPGQAGQEPRGASAQPPPPRAVELGPVLEGRLANGLRYAILPRRANEPGVGLFLQVKGGFIAERRPGERGLAHLIEHLIFHSPTRTAPDELRRFRNVGLPLSLPEPAGGTTNWRESDYYLVSLTTRPAEIEALLGLYREVMSELNFRADAVDGQRIEVMREMADKRRGNLILADYHAAVAPGGPNDVIDAQNSDDVATASVDTIRALYHRLYRPENVSVVIVGDVDAREMAASIERRFGDWRGVGPAPERVAIPAFRRELIQPVSFSARLEGRSSATITVASAMRAPPRTRKGQAEALLMDMLAVRAVNERLSLSQGPGPPSKYGAFIENGEQGHRMIMLWDDFVGGQWRPAVAGLGRTACDLSGSGLSEREWGAAGHYLLGDLERRAATMSNLEAAREMSHAMAAGRAPIAPGELLLRARAWLPMVRAPAMNRWWRRQWRAGIEHVRVEGPELAQVADPLAAIGAAAGRSGGDGGCAAVSQGAAR